MLPGGTQARSWTRQYSIIRVSLGALVHRGYTWQRGGGNRWHEERHSARCCPLTQIGTVPSPGSDGLSRNLQTVRNLLLRRTRSPQCQRLSDCPSCAMSAQSRFPTVVVEECTGSFPPLASAFLGPSGNQWLPDRRKRYVLSRRHRQVPMRRPPTTARNAQASGQGTTACIRGRKGST